MKRLIIVALLSSLLIFAIDRERIPTGSKVFVGDMNGFGAYITAAITKKKLPVLVVAKKEDADFEITGNAESEKPGWARTIFLGQGRSNEQASVNLINLKTGVVVFGYAVSKVNSVNGKQSAAEACAKHLREAVQKAK